MASNGIGGRVKEARERQGMKRIQLAVAVDVTSNTIRNYEEGLTRIDAAVLARISDALGTDSEWLLHGDKEVAR